MRKLAVALAAALMLVGCGDGGEDEAEADEGLQDFLGLPDYSEDQEAMEARFAEQHREREEAIAECMAEQGFEYVPSEQPTMSASSHPRQEMSEEEFREEYGFGLSTLDMEDTAVEEDMEADPNHEIQEEMDEAERQAYQEALHGEQPDPDEDGVAEWEPGGCQAEAQDSGQDTAQRLSDELGDELREMGERAQADPRIREAEEGYLACMGDAGWDFSERHEAHQHIADQMNELRQEAFEEMPEFDPTEEPDEEPPPQPEPDPDKLADLQAEELEVAQAEWDCISEHFGEDGELEQEVYAEYEREFIEEHRDVLEDIRDS